MADLKAMFANMSNKTMTKEVEQNGDTSSKSKAKKGTIENTYQKKSQLEHILLRPDTYIGSVESVTETMWVYDEATNCMAQKVVTYVPGLYKIFDEILVNAADNKQRDPKMDCIKIEIDQDNNSVSIWNNGKGIPVEIHKEENMYVPTMIFGHLLTSSNYNDEEEKVTGGRNGYGAKLCNIFSTKFTVETSSNEYRRQFKQTWGSNMSKASDPKVKDCKDEDFTKITFCPDLQKFKMEKLDDDIVSIMKRRAYDIAASTRGVKVFLNGKRLPVKNFKDYIDLYIQSEKNDDENLKVVYETVNDRWEVAMTISSRGFQQVSFVNSIATTKGGRHVDYVTDMLVKQIIEVIKKKNKGGVNIKPFQVKSHMWIFINCLIVNPTFDSQTKENMTLQAKSFGSKCAASDKFINQIMKSGIVESVLTWAKFKAQTELAKKSGNKKTKLKGIAKLEDANEAGTKNALKCTLILTEGDSAKSLAVSGLGVIGRDLYGVFPLRGKLLNVREATHKQLLENAEINNLIKILGLQYKKKYNSDDDMKSLRYGKVMIMTDQDQDGSHIKGLLINFIHYNWPELLRRDFLEEFITPIVKAKKRNEELSFYSLPEFEEWKTNTPNHHTYSVKYYKGLGTSTSAEAKEYFTNMTRHRIKFRYSGQQDDDHIVLAFSRKHIENRKEWLSNFMEDSKRRKEMSLPEKYLYCKDTRYVSFTDFVNLELVLFSNADNVRSIPCMVDGLKPGQRKVLFTCFKRNDKKEVKVAQLAGSVAEMSCYHHGEVSLCATIVNLAQNFIGSNNINLLEPRGQFGTRLTGGKDSASPRYIFTKMSPLTRLIFNPLDDPLMKYEYDDNQRIEPTWYMPIIPMVLVNGADGIGTGWMTKIPNYNPREIVRNIRAMLDGEEPNKMIPWYKNFRGTIEDCGDSRYVSSGEISIIGDDKVEITELPVGTWTQNYKENVLEAMLHGSEKVKSTIADYKEYNTDTTVKFVVTLLNGQMANMEKEGFHKVFKLQSMIHTTSMCIFDELGCLRRVDTVMEMLNNFYNLRLKIYQKRKDYLEGMLEAEAEKLSNQARFIMEKCSGELVIENKKRLTITEELLKRGYLPDPIAEWKRNCAMEEEEENENDKAEDDEEEQQQEDVKPSSSKKKGKDADAANNFSRLPEVKKFDYLLGMSMWMLTDERKNELLRQKENKLKELESLRKKTKEDLYRQDLDVFMEKLDQVEEKERLVELGVKLKTEKKLPGKRKVVSDTLPTANAERIEPQISDDIKKKIALAVKSKEKRVVKKENTSAADLEDDEFDNMVSEKKSLLQRVGSKLKGKKDGKDGLKQTKINFPKANGRGRKKKKGSDDESDVKIIVSEDSDLEWNKNVKEVESPVKERTKRNVKKPIKYSLSDSTSSSSDDEDNLRNNDAIKEEFIQERIDAVSTDDEEEVQPARPMETSDDMFDSLIGKSPSPKKEELTPPKRKRGPAKAPKKPVLTDSDSDSKSKPMKKMKTVVSDDDDDFVKTKPKPKGRGRAKKIVSSDHEDDDLNPTNLRVSDSPPQVERGRGRAKKPATYVFDDSD